MKNLQKHESNHADTPVILGSGDHCTAAISSDGIIHVISGRWHRFGKNISTLSQPVSLLPDSFQGVVSNPRLHIDHRGQPHLVFQKGRYRGAKSGWYTTFTHGAWLPPEECARVNDTNGTRAYIPDVTSDNAGNVLISYCDMRSTGATMSAYRWRSARGDWSPLKTADYVKSGHSTPKVAWTSQGFFLLYHGNPSDSVWEWYVSGPVVFDGTFPAGRPLKTEQLGFGGQNEGGNFEAIDDSLLIASSNIMESRGWWIQRAGLWVSTIRPDSITTELIGFVDSTNAHDGGTFSPTIAFDKHTGKIVLSFLIKERAFFTVKDTNGWQPFQRVYPEVESVQGSIRNNPTVADIPGPGVLFCFRSDSTILARTIQF